MDSNKVKSRKKFKLKDYHVKYFGFVCLAIAYCIGAYYIAPEIGWPLVIISTLVLIFAICYGISENMY